MTDTTVKSGQTVSNLDVTNGNFLDVQAGGTANNTTIENGGLVAVEASSGGLFGIFGPQKGGIANGVTVHSGGNLELRGANSAASNVVLDGGALEIDNTASVTGSLTFGPTTGTQESLVTLDGNDGNFKPTIITGFSASSAIDDNGVIFAGATLKTTVTGGNTIATLSGSGVTNTFTFAGTPQLTIAPDDFNDDGKPEAVIVTTNTTTLFAPAPPAAMQSQPTIASGQTEQASGQSPAASAPSSQAQPSEVHASRPVMSFLSQPQSAVPAMGSPSGSGMSDATPAQASLSSIVHELTLPQNQGLGSAILGVLSQPQHQGVESAMAGFLPNQTGATGGEALAAIDGGALHHATTAATAPMMLHHIG